MAGYYGSTLPRRERAVYDALHQGFAALDGAIRVERLAAETVGEIYQRLKLDEPGLWFVTGYQCRFYPQATHMELLPEYLFDRGKIREHRQAIDSRIARLVRPLADQPPRERVLAIHDFILSSVRYDKLKKAYSHEIIGPLTQGVGVCEGIAKTVKALCDAAGVECVVALSHNAPERGVQYRHAWNVVKLEGKWYHLDATFDNSLQCGAPRYDYCWLDDRHIFRDHQPLVYPVPPCADGDGFYYRRLSLTREEQVLSRVKQALRKKEAYLVFHWRGGGLNRTILTSLLTAAQELAAAKGQQVECAVNAAQAVIQLHFTRAQTAGLTVQQPDENRGDTPELAAE